MNFSLTLKKNCINYVFSLKIPKCCDNIYKVYFNMEYYAI